MTDPKKTLKERIDKTHKEGVELGKKVAELLRIKQAAEKLNAERRKHLKELEKKTVPSDFTMYDTITVGSVPNWIPSRPFAVAGYVGGFWPTYNALVKRFPKAKHLSIAVTRHQDADCLDIESGDARPDQAGPWVKRQKGLHKKLIVLYFSVSNKGAVEQSLREHGIPRHEVKFWGAHYTYVPHHEPGFDAIQWTDKALGRNLDASLCHGMFL